MVMPVMVRSVVMPAVMTAAASAFPIGNTLHAGGVVSEGQGFSADGEKVFFHADSSFVNCVRRRDRIGSAHEQCMRESVEMTQKKTLLGKTSSRAP
jgi:hypothetical protein